MPYTEMENMTLTKLALISKRARKESKFQFTSLARLLNEVEKTIFEEKFSASLDAVLVSSD